jgi:uroporphyrinogen decarboxylase
MNHRERVFKTLRSEPVDRIARGEFFIADDFVRDFFALREDAPIEFEHHREIITQLDLDLACVSVSAGWGALEQPDEPRAFEMLARWRAENDRFVCALMDGPFSAAVQARGFNELMHAIRGAPELARDLFQRGADAARVIANAARDAGAEGVVLGEDIAYGKQTYIAPDDLRALYFPALRDLVRDLRARDLVVFFHSDGNLNAVLDDLVACQFDGIQGLEPDAGMTMRGTRARVGDAITLWGNLNFDFLSAPRADAEIARATRDVIESNGRVIFGSCGGLVAGMNVETVRRVHRQEKPGFSKKPGF